MKKGLALLLAAAMALAGLTALAETGEAGAPNLLDGAIIETGDDGTVTVHGMTSEPVSIGVGEYVAALNSQIALRYFMDGDLDMFGPWWSDGAWVRVFPFNDGAILVRSAGQADDSPLVGVSISLPKGGDDDAETRSELQSLSAAAFSALPQLSQLGSTTMMLIEYNEDSVAFREDPEPWWTENGWALRYVAKTYSLEARIDWTGEAPEITAPYTGEAYLHVEGLTREVFEERLASLVTRFGMKLNPHPEDAEPDALGKGVTMIPYDNDWSATVFAFYEGDGPEAPLRSVMIAEWDEDSLGAWSTTMSAFLAVMEPQMSQDEKYAVSLLTGGNGGWDELCAMDPYAAINGVRVYTEIEDPDGSPVLVGMITGTN